MALSPWVSYTEAQVQREMEHGRLERMRAGWAGAPPGEKQLPSGTALGKGLWLGKPSGSFSGFSGMKLQIHCRDVSIFLRYED